MTDSASTFIAEVEVKPSDLMNDTIGSLVSKLRSFPPDIKILETIPEDFKEAIVHSADSLSENGI